MIDDTSQRSEPNRWWGRYRVAEGTGAVFTIGPTTLVVEHCEWEWRLATEVSDDPAESTVRTELPADVGNLLEAPAVARFATASRSDELLLTPALADRPVVNRPEKPLSVLAGDEVTVYVSTPLWFRAEVADGNRLLLDAPLFRPSDTWFGPDTTSGELCYASRTFCRLHLDRVPRRPHRALSAVRIVNRSASPLLLERINIPVPHLALFVTSDGFLVTEDVALEHVAEGELTAVSLSARPPAVERGADRIAGPRERSGQRLALRAFGSLFR